jgi:hypothetical protein
MKHLITLTICLIASIALADTNITQGDKGKVMNQGGTIAGGDIINTDIKNVKLGGGNSTVDIGDISLQAGSSNSTAQGGSAVANGGEGGNATIGDNTNTSKSSANSKINVSYEDRLQGITPQLPMPLWNAPQPEEKFFWNKLGVDIEELTKISWTKKKAANLVDSAKIWFIRTGFLIWKSPIKVQCSFIGKYKKSEHLRLETNKSNNTILIGEVSISGNKDIKALVCIGRAIEEALSNGTDIAVIQYGMNTINEGSSAGIGGTVVDSDGNVASSGLLSLSSAESKKLGEPAIILTCYKR